MQRPKVLIKHTPTVTLLIVYTTNSITKQSFTLIYCWRTVVDITTALVKRADATNNVTDDKKTKRDPQLIPNLFYP